MKLLNEFKEFAVKGNMMEMAIGIIIGASFNSVIDVLVKQILLPPLSLLSNGLNIDSKKIILREADISSSGDIINEEVAINYGFFIETFIDFMIVAFTIFIVIKFLNKLKIVTTKIPRPRRCPHYPRRLLKTTFKMMKVFTTGLDENIWNGS